MSYYFITMDINKLKEGYEKCKKENRYQIVDTAIAKLYFESSDKDLHRAKKELINDSIFWSLAALDSAVTQLMYGLAVKEKGLRPKSRVCAENLVCAEDIIKESEYAIIVKIRELRNKAMYDALFRKDLVKKQVNELINDFEDFFLKKGGKND